MKKKNSKFKEKVLDALKKIPKGKAVTYSRLAEMAGHPGSARAVGTVMKYNCDPKGIPCYKVVRSDRKIGDYSAKGGKKRKEFLLKKEGIKLKNGKIELEYMYKK